MPPEDDDATVLIRPKRPGRTGTAAAAAAAIAVLLLAGGLAWTLRPAPPPPAPPHVLATTPPPAAPPPAAPPPATPPSAAAPASPPPQPAPKAAPQSAPPQPGPPQPGPQQPAPPQPAPVQPAPVQPTPVQPTPPPSTPDPPPIRIRAGSAAAILADTPEETTVYRLDADARVLVLDFASLREQALMLNRMAMFIERNDAPRDQVLTDGRLAATMRAAGVQAETFYYGHDYRAADMTRFFATADADGVDLTPEESWLHTLIHQERMDLPGAVGCILSIPRVGARTGIDAHARATILRHELSHAAYFTDAGFTAYARHFWNETLSDDERAHMRGFLRRQGYDTANEDLMMNEAQAYLVFTRDARFFDAAAAGLDANRAATLQSAFERAMPKMWLRTELPP